MFSGTRVTPLLSWGVNITLGIHHSGEMNITHLKLHEHKGLYIHNHKDYYTSDPLPE